MYFSKSGGRGFSIQNNYCLCRCMQLHLLSTVSLKFRQLKNIHAKCIHLRSFVSGIRSLTENKRASFQRLKKRNANFWKCLAFCRKVISRTSAFDSFNLHKPPTLLMCKSNVISKADVRHLFLLVPNFTGVRGRLRIGSFKGIIKIRIFFSQGSRCLRI